MYLYQTERAEGRDVTLPLNIEPLELPIFYYLSRDNDDNHTLPISNFTVQFDLLFSLGCKDSLSIAHTQRPTEPLVEAHGMRKRVSVS